MTYLMRYDGGPDDSYVEGEEDQEIDWGKVAQLDERYLEILSIEDPDERLEAARRLTQEMAGE